MYTVYENIAIRAMAVTVPPTILDNEEYAATVKDRRYKRRIQYTGIKQRREPLLGQKGSDLVCVAAERVIDKLGWDKESIKTLIYITQSPDIYAPSTAMIIQAKLGLSLDIMAFDVNLGCSGFTTGVQIMAGILSQTKGRGLLLMGDSQKWAPGDEFSDHAIIVGAGMAAIAMEWDAEVPAIPAFQMTDGNKYKTLYASAEDGHVMDGNEIVLFSLNEVVNSLNEFHKHFQIEKETIDYYALHQAQKIIVDGVANNCAIPSEKVLCAYEMYGNTSSASVPFALCANTDKFQKERIKILACGFGIGLAWSGLVFEISSASVLPISESGYIYPVI